MILRVLLVSALLSPIVFAQSSPAVLQPRTVTDLLAESTVYYNLSDNKAVEEATAIAEPDSWDISFSGTAIAINGAVQFVDEAFDAIVEAPTDGYTEQAGDDGTPLPGGSGTGWYHYNMDFHVLTPVAKRSILFKTRAGLYGKLMIVSYYQGGADGFGNPRYYTFRYAIQWDGSTRLASEQCDPDALECKVEQ